MSDLEAARASLAKVAPDRASLWVEAARFADDLLRIADLPHLDAGSRWKCLSHVAVLHALIESSAEARREGAHWMRDLAVKVAADLHEYYVASGDGLRSPELAELIATRLAALPLEEPQT
jgi:hypothetical protein